MYDTTVHAKTLSRRLTKADFSRDKQLFDPAYLALKIAEGVAVGLGGFANTPLKQSDLRGKKVYQLERLADLLVVRHVTANIKRITSVKQNNRKIIVDCIRTLMSEGTAFRVYKFDIKSFYESVSIADVMDKLQSDVAFSGQSCRILKTLFDEFDGQGIMGLPRGLALSATLSEYLLRPFDRKLSGRDDVWYYSRFVDDIIIITKFDHDVDNFKKFATEALPPGLHFNRKSKRFDFKPWASANGDVPEDEFDFLGYRFVVGHAFRGGGSNLIRRSVRVDLSPSKVRKIKTRIAKSIMQFNQDGNFKDLHDRIKMLTSNFTFVDKETDQRRISGIYYNYPLIDGDSSTSLPSLDRFLRSAITKKHARNNLLPVLTNAQKRALLGLGFQRGFQERRFFFFGGNRIAQLNECWKYA